jgi:hypothetical protein
LEPTKFLGKTGKLGVEAGPIVTVCPFSAIESAAEIRDLGPELIPLGP